MKICVVGTGTMGNGIAQTFAQAGHDVLLKGRSEASLGKAHKAIEKSLSKLVEKGKMEAAEKELVEVIKGQLTSQEVHDKVMAIAAEVGKTPVSVNEAPGFVVNRILIPMVNEGIGIYADGVATKEEIDEAMKLGANHPMGPLALGDLIGLDVCLAIMEVLYNEFGDSKYRPHPLLRKMVRANLLGRKTGIGFYDYRK